MKKITIFLVTLFVSFMFSACNSNSMVFSEMKGICNDIEKNFDKYTVEDFEKYTERFSELEKKLEATELTSEEKKEEKGRLVIQPTIGGITSQRTGEMMFEEVSSLKISLARRGMTAKIEPRQFNIGQI